MAVDENRVLVPQRIAAALAPGLSVERLHRWSTSAGLVHPVRSDHGGQLFRFDDLVEMLVASEIIDYGVHPRRLISFVRALQKDGIERPLASMRWAVSAGEPFACHADGEWVGSRAPMQTVAIELVDPDEIRARLRDRLEERRGIPGEIESRRGSHAGRPMFAGTRTPVDAVHSYLRRGRPREEILAAFPHLTDADIERAEELLKTA